jgi:hypothetical protein
MFHKFSQTVSQVLISGDKLKLANSNKLLMCYIVCERNRTMEWGGKE